jgi:hypothetical protein
MTRRPKAKSGSGTLRKYRQKLDMTGALIAGPPTCLEVVYAYRFPSRPDRIKIGYSSRGLKRVLEQSTSFPEKPQIVFVIHDNRARDIEVSFHEALKHKQADVLGTEWFDVTMRDLRSVSPILRKAAGVGRVARRFKAVGSVALIIAGLPVYPAAAVIVSAATSDVIAIDAMSIASTHMSAIFDANISEIINSTLWIRSFLEGYGANNIPWIIAAIPFPVLALIPWRRSRRQAY